MSTPSGPTFGISTGVRWIRTATAEQAIRCSMSTTPTFRVDFTPLVIDVHSPIGEQHTFINHVDVTFSEEIAGATFTSADVVLTGPHGPIAVLDPVHQQDNTWRISVRRNSRRRGRTPSSSARTSTIWPDTRMLDGLHGYVRDSSGGPDRQRSGGSGGRREWQSTGRRVARGQRRLGECGPSLDRPRVSLRRRGAGRRHVARVVRPPDGPRSGEFYDQSATVTLPQVAEGDYWIVVVVDGGSGSR